MGTVEGAPKDEHGYTCPACRRQGLSESVMAKDWSPAAWDYVPVICLECREFWRTLHLGAKAAQEKGPDALRHYKETEAPERFRRYRKATYAFADAPMGITATALYAARRFLIRLRRACPWLDRRGRR
jgi:hypothetical protein